MTADVKTVGKFARLHSQLGKAEVEVNKLKAEIKELEPQIVEYFQRHSMTKHSGYGVTLYLMRELWPGMVETSTPEALAEALDAAGLGQTAKRRMNVQSMRGIVNETVGTSQGDPEAILLEAYPQLAGHVKVSEVFRIGKRRS